MPSNPFLSPAGQAALAQPLFGASPFQQASFSSPAGPFPADPNAALGALMSTGLNTYNFPLDLGTTKYWMSFGVYTYEKASWNSVGQTQIIGTVFLPLAEQLVDSATVSYEMPETGILGGAIMSGGITGNYAKSAIEGAESLAQQAITSTVGAVAGLASGGNPGAGFQARTGKTINQYMTVLLKGPTFKVREFSWRFSPRNVDETNTLVKILAALKNAQAPFIASETTNAFFGWPNVFQIKFQMPGDSGTPSNMGLRLFDMLPAVMNDLIIDYTPAGAPAFHGATSAPAFYRVMMRFTELEVWLRNQYRGLDGLAGGNTIWDSHIQAQAAPTFLQGGGLPPGA